MVGPQESGYAGRDRRFLEAPPHRRIREGQGPHDPGASGGQMSNLLAKWRSIPRVGRWIVYTGLFVVLFFAVIMPYFDLLEKRNTRVASLERLLSSGRDLADTSP